MSQLETRLRAFKKGVRIQCYNPVCLHAWEYKGDMLYGCCPSCRHNVNVELGKIKFAETLQSEENNKE